MTTTTAPAAPPTAAARTADRIPQALAVTAAGVSGAVVVALVLSYCLELHLPYPHVFGPISDIGTIGWDLVAAPLLWGLGDELGGRALRRLSAATVVLSVAGAAAGVGLVEKTLSFAVTTPISVLAVLAQALWLLVAVRAMRRDGGWSPAVVASGLLIAVGQLVAAPFVAVSFAFGWGSPVQLVVMIVGLVAGAPAWCAWPVWFGLLARDLAR